MKKLVILAFALVALVSCAEKSYVIVQIADSQLGFDAAIKTQEPGAEYVNDLTYEVEYLRKAVAKINEIGPDAVIFTGDQVNLSDNEEQWDTFEEIIAGIDQAICRYHVPGNHDVVVSEGKVDMTPFATRFGEDMFVSRNDGVNIVGINTNLIKYNDPAEEDQKEWLRSILGESKASDVTLIFGHHPFFGEDIDEEDGYFQVQKAKRHEYFDMFVEMGVDAVFAGHLHDSRAAEYQGIPMLTTTSSAYQLGDSKPSIRVIIVKGSEVSEELVEI